MTSREWRDLQIKLKHLRSCMETNKNYIYAPSSAINSEGVDGWIEDAFSCQRCRGMYDWPELMRDLNTVYKLIMTEKK